MEKMFEVMLQVLIFHLNNPSITINVVTVGSVQASSIAMSYSMSSLVVNREVVVFASMVAS
jgi:hypothetical protein